MDPAHLRRNREMAVYSPLDEPESVPSAPTAGIVRLDHDQWSEGPMGMSDRAPRTSRPSEPLSAASRAVRVRGRQKAPHAHVYPTTARGGRSCAQGEADRGRAEQAQCAQSRRPRRQRPSPSALCPSH